MASIVQALTVMVGMIGVGLGKMFELVFLSPMKYAVPPVNMISKITNKRIVEVEPRLITELF